MARPWQLDQVEVDAGASGQVPFLCLYLILHLHLQQQQQQQQRQPEVKAVENFVLLWLSTHIRLPTQHPYHSLMLLLLLLLLLPPPLLHTRVQKQLR